MRAAPAAALVRVRWPLLFGAAVVVWLIGPATDYEAFLFNTFLAYTMASIGTVFLMGWSGQVSFAQAAFFGIGAYTTAHLARGIDPGLPVTVLVAATCAAAFALPMAIPAVRLRGVFLALTTLAYQAAIERFLFRQIWFSASKPQNLVARLNGKIVVIPGAAKGLPESLLVTPKTISKAPPAT